MATKLVRLVRPRTSLSVSPRTTRRLASMLACDHLAGMNGFLAQLEITFSCGTSLAMMRAEMLSELVTESSTLSRDRRFWDVLCLLFLLFFLVIYLGLVGRLAFLLVAGVEVWKLCCPTRWCPLVSSGGPADRLYRRSCCDLEV